MAAESFCRPLIFVAHPDDETLACGGLLQRMPSSLVVFATDGTPAGFGLERKYESLKTYTELRFSGGFPRAEPRSQCFVRVAYAGGRFVL